MKNINLALLILTMGSASQDGERAPKEVTVVVSRKIKHGCEKDYDEWLRRLLILARKRPGYVGATTIMDDGRLVFWWRTGSGVSIA
jgi:antibiotic biosynthesis monooxygenase (ABM) superfamily enzyme